MTNIFFSRPKAYTLLLDWPCPCIVGRFGPSSNNNNNKTLVLWN